MKKIARIIPVVLVTAAMVFAAGCESSSSKSDSSSSGSIVGIWKLSNAYLGSYNLNSELGNYDASATINVEFKADGTFTISASGSATGVGSGSDSVSGTYTTSGNSLTLNVTIDELGAPFQLVVTYDISGNQLDITVPAATVQLYLALALAAADDPTLTDGYDLSGDLRIVLDRQ